MGLRAYCTCFSWIQIRKKRSVRTVCDLTGGHPFYTQHVCHAIWELCEPGEQVTAPLIQAAVQVLLSYAWPGNVRELQNYIERAVILSPGKVLRAPLAELKQSVARMDCSGECAAPKAMTLKDAEHDHIIQALAETNWVIGGPKGAAARLGLQRTTLISKMQRLGISRAQA